LEEANVRSAEAIRNIERASDSLSLGVHSGGHPL